MGVAMTARPATVPTYAEVERLVECIIRSWCRCYGGDPDELRGEARLLYAKARHSWDPERSPFGKHLGAKIWFGFKSLHRRNWRRLEKRLQRVPADLRAVRERVRAFDPEAFRQELSEDASLVVKLVLNSSVVEKHHNPIKKRAVLAEYLLDLGWAAERVLASFQEVKDSL